MTALHEHVGSVAEYLSDPDFVAGKWPKDRAMGSVNNSFQLAVIAILTGELSGETCKFGLIVTAVPPTCKPH